MEEKGEKESFRERKRRGRREEINFKCLTEVKIKGILLLCEYGFFP